MQIDPGQPVATSRYCQQDRASPNGLAFSGAADRRIERLKWKCPVGSDPNAAGGGRREGSEWQRSARRKPASSGEAAAGYRNRTATHR